MSCQNIIKSAAFGNFQCGKVIQGGVHLCSTCMAKRDRLLPVENVEEKRDFENLDVRLYLALKSMTPHWQAMSEQGAIEGGLRYVPEDDDELQAALSVMRDFEDSHGPLPEWAIARNFGYELVQGAQLSTKDGRRTGNGWIINVRVDSRNELCTKENPYGEITLFDVLTDAGNCIMNMSASELENQFWVGDFISTKERILKDFDRLGKFKNETEVGF